MSLRVKRKMTYRLLFNSFVSTLTKIDRMLPLIQPLNSDESLFNCYLPLLANSVSSVQINLHDYILRKLRSANFPLKKKYQPQNDVILAHYGH